MKNSIISYGIGKEYLPDWGIQEALREIYQNFLDYGEYLEHLHFYPYGEDHIPYVSVSIASSYKFEDLSILKLGKSIKGEGSRGKHGEGLKMAMMVLTRGNYNIKIFTETKEIRPLFRKVKHIGEVFCINVLELENPRENHCVVFDIPLEDFNAFKNHFITPDDILFKDGYHGEKVDKPAGEIYAGGLYVSTEKNLKGSYNIPAEKLHLDRDRRIPSAFSVSYHSSKINEAEAKFNWKDTEFDDYKHIETVPLTLKKQVIVKELGGKVEFMSSAVNKETGEVTLERINNPNIVQSFLRDNYFTKAIASIKATLIKKMGVNALLLDFRRKYVTTVEARREFDIILARLGIRPTD